MIMKEITFIKNKDYVLAREFFSKRYPEVGEQMASIKKSKKTGNLWFSDITDLEGTVIPKLSELESEQAVELRIGKDTGIWTRFKGKAGKIQPALKYGNDVANRLWNQLGEGISAPLKLERVLSIDESRRYSTRRAEGVKWNLVESKIKSNALCLGVDVAWWGGGGAPSDSMSRTETIAYAMRVDGKWSELHLKRVDLNPSYNKDADEYTPNSDPKADLLVQNIMAIVESHNQLNNVVLALDMPILANDGAMEKPKKSYAKAEKGGEYRQCDWKWMETKAQSPAGWRNVNILTGAPIAPRIKALLSQLETKGFHVFDKSSELGDRVVFECFPNEILWSSGVLGLAEGLTFKTLQLYKSIGKDKIPLPEQIFLDLWKLPVERALRIAGLPEEKITSWQNQFKEWLISDKTFNDVTKIGLTGKKFDDAIDSVLSLSAVVGFVEGHAHIHLGDDSKDGHIIGPGPLSIKA